MKKTGIALAVLAAILVTSAQVHAQKPNLKPQSATSTPDLSKLDIGKILQQLQATTVPQSGDEVTPLQVVAEFLLCRSPVKLREISSIRQRE
jgi:hypothetical protein